MNTKTENASKIIIESEKIGIISSPSSSSELAIDILVERFPNNIS